MDIADQFQQVRVFFADDGFVSVLEEVACPLVSFVEGDGVTGHEFSHDLAERGRPGAQQEVKMVRDHGPRVALGLGLLEDDGQTIEEGLTVFVILEEGPSLNPSGHNMLKKPGGV